ncbi:MAG: nucleotidyltransferase family protein [Clostridia bacterium]|nr:nucleotidyltransferase family protein [Clostridia bacterium]
MRLAAVLLAAGKSRRFGKENKLLASVGGVPMAALAMERLAALGAEWTLAVVSCGEVAALARERGLSVVWNGQPERGMAGSIALGVRAAQKWGADAVLLMAADQPKLSLASLRALLDGFARGGSRIACLADETHWGNPAVLAIAYAPELLALGGDRGAKAVLKRHEDELTRVPCAAARELDDADDPQTLAALIETLK